MMYRTSFFVKKPTRKKGVVQDCKCEQQHWWMRWSWCFSPNVWTALITRRSLITAFSSYWNRSRMDMEWAIYRFRMSADVSLEWTDNRRSRTSSEALPVHFLPTKSNLVILWTNWTVDYTDWFLKTRVAHLHT